MYEENFKKETETARMTKSEENREARAAQANIDRRRDEDLARIHQELHRVNMFRNVEDVIPNRISTSAGPSMTPEEDLSGNEVPPSSPNPAVITYVISDDSEPNVSPSEAAMHEEREVASSASTSVESKVSIHSTKHAHDLGTNLARPLSENVQDKAQSEICMPTDWDDKLKKFVKRCVRRRRFVRKCLKEQKFIQKCLKYKDRVVRFIGEMTS